MRPHLTLAASLLTLAPPPAPAHTTPLTSPPLNLTLSCPNGNPMWLPSTIHPPILGVIVKLLSRAAALKRIATTEQSTGATIDPTYTHNQRVIVQDAYHRRYFVLVPTA